jgi:superfamily II DNA/RNA helicase
MEYDISSGHVLDIFIVHVVKIKSKNVVVSKKIVHNSKEDLLVFTSCSIAIIFITWILRRILFTVAALKSRMVPDRIGTGLVFAGV